VVENEQQDDENDLVEELSPTLHKKRTGDLSATVKAIVLGGDFSRSDSVLHTRGCGHGILTSNTDSIEEESPDVTDNPSVLGHTPCSGQHEQTHEHDYGILNETIATTQPVTENTNKDLTLNELAST
jgi:hypothetical protein